MTGAQFLTDEDISLMQKALLYWSRAVSIASADLFLGMGDEAMRATKLAGLIINPAHRQALLNAKVEQ